MKCILCKSINVNFIGEIDTAKLKKLYKKLGVSIDNLIKLEKIEFLQCSNCDLKYFHPQISGDEIFYRELQKIDWYYLDEKEEYKYAKNYIKQIDKVLEIGAGKGAFAKLLETKDYTGLDFSISAKELAKLNGVIIKNESIQDHALDNLNFYDVVCSFQVLEHVADPYDFISAKVKVLKSKGLLIIAVPSEDSFLKYVTNGILNMPPHHITRWSDRSLSCVADVFGLELVNCYHQRVEPIHQNQYLSTFIENTILNMRMLDTSIRRKFVSKFSQFISKFLLKGLKLEILPVGHTVVAIYQKK